MGRERWAITKRTSELSSRSLKNEGSRQGLALVAIRCKVYECRGVLQRLSGNFFKWLLIPKAETEDAIDTLPSGFPLPHLKSGHNTLQKFDRVKFACSVELTWMQCAPACLKIRDLVMSSFTTAGASSFNPSRNEREIVYRPAVAMRGRTFYVAHLFHSLAAVPWTMSGGV